MYKHNIYSVYIGTLFFKAVKQFFLVFNSSNTCGFFILAFFSVFLTAHTSPFFFPKPPPLEILFLL